MLKCMYNNSWFNIRNQFSRDWLANVHKYDFPASSHIHIILSQFHFDFKKISKWQCLINCVSPYCFLLSHFLEVFRGFMSSSFCTWLSKRYIVLYVLKYLIIYKDIEQGLKSSNELYIKWNKIVYNKNWALKKCYRT